MNVILFSGEVISESEGEEDESEDEGNEGNEEDAEAYMQEQQSKLEQEKESILNNKSMMQAVSKRIHISGIIRQLESHI